MDTLKEIRNCENYIDSAMLKCNLSEADLKTVEEMASTGDYHREVDFDVDVAIEVLLLKQRLEILKSIAD